jgi:hypothetical protein
VSEVHEPAERLGDGQLGVGERGDLEVHDRSL